MEEEREEGRGVEEGWLDTSKWELQDKFLGLVT